MNKTEFLDALRHALGKLPSYEVEQSIAFYAEMIDDRIEDGMSEQEAVAALGSVHAIAAQIVAETPPIPKAIAKANTGSRTLNIVLLAILSPIWVTLALAFACMVLAIYLAIWSVVVALWAVVAMLLLCAPIGVFGLAWCAATGFPLSGIWVFGCGLGGAGPGLGEVLRLRLGRCRPGIVLLVRRAGRQQGARQPHAFVRPLGKGAVHQAEAQRCQPDRAGRSSSCLAAKRRCSS